MQLNRITLLKWFDSIAMTTSKPRASSVQIVKPQLRAKAVSVLLTLQHNLMWLQFFFLSFKTLPVYNKVLPARGEGSLGGASEVGPADRCGSLTWRKALGGGAIPIYSYAWGGKVLNILNMTIPLPQCGRSRVFGVSVNSPLSERTLWRMLERCIFLSRTPALRYSLSNRSRNRRSSHTSSSIAAAQTRRTLI